MQRLEIHSADLDVEIFGRQPQQPIAYAATHQPRPTDAAHGLEHRPELLGNLGGKPHHFFSAAIPRAAAITQLQPIKNETPPNGAVEAPSQVGAFNAKLYSDPEKRITPVNHHRTAQPIRRVAALAPAPTSNHFAAAKMATAGSK